MKARSASKKVIGLTGGVGTGKTTVARMFRREGAAVIDADKVARAMVRPGSPAIRKIARQFDRGVVTPRGTLDRRRLGELVFGDSRLRKRLERILHPLILKDIREKARDSRKALVVIDAPLLFETGLEKSVDAVVVVRTSPRTQVRRAMARTGLSRGEILSRIAAQLPLKDKVRSADFVIDNNGTLQQTEKQVKVIRRSVWRS
jgi:dephospho-CoA kinase